MPTERLTPVTRTLRTHDTLSPTTATGNITGATSRHAPRWPAADLVALTSIPLWIAFLLLRRPPSRRFTYGLGRVEDLAGIVIVLFIAASAAVAGWESLQAFGDPQGFENVRLVAAAGVIGFVGNEAVAVYRIRVGRRIGSAALVADGYHARTDGFTSLGVLASAVGVGLGFPLTDPVVGLVITVAILVILVGAARDVMRRLLDAVDPGMVDDAERVLRDVDGVVDVESVRMRWTGHRVRAEADVRRPDGDEAAVTSATGRQGEPQVVPGVSAGRRRGGVVQGGRERRQVPAHRLSRVR